MYCINTQRLRFMALFGRSNLLWHTALFLYLCEVVQRLDDISLDGELEQDELLSESLLCLSAELQHFPAAQNNKAMKHQKTVRKNLKQPVCL